MKAVVIISCLTAVSVAQFHGSSGQGQGQGNFLHVITQPHLPRDQNVLDATHQFLNKFAELKALADAAPDPLPTHSRMPTIAPRHFTPQPTSAPAISSGHRFAAPHTFTSPQTFAPQPVKAPTFAPQPVQAPTFAVPQPVSTPQTFTHHRPTSMTNDFDVNSEISQLLASHKASLPSPPPTPAPAPVQQVPTRTHHAPARPSSFPSFNVLNNLGSMQHGNFRAATQAPAQAFDPSIRVTNEHGQIINPQRFPGPLAHSVPAGVGGTSGRVTFTPEVTAAQKALARAHADILKQQASLARPFRTRM